MTALYEYEVSFDDDRDAEIVETTMPPSAAEEALREEYGDHVQSVTYVGRVA